MYNTKAYSATSATASLSSTTIPRRDPTERDVQIQILFCGICHSDLHYKRDEWHDVMPAVYPCVPGHEIVGRVTKVGSAVTKYKMGDSGRRRLPRRLRSHLLELSGRIGAVLPEPDSHLRLAGPAWHGTCDLRWLLRQHRRR